MQVNQIEEALVSLYLRLNGYLTSGFIVHAPRGNKTEIDILGIRFPYHTEPEREVGPCAVLAPPADRVDIIIGEVKGGAKPKFNARLHTNPEALRSVLRRIGALPEHAIGELSTEISALLDPRKLGRARSIARIELGLDQTFASVPTQLRFPLFAMGRQRDGNAPGSCVYANDVLDYVWRCLVPQHERCSCAVRYNLEQWGPAYTPLVRYFKARALAGPGTMADLIAVVGRRPAAGATSVHFDQAELV